MFTFYSNSTFSFHRFQCIQIDFIKFWPSKEETMDGGYFQVTHMESEDCALSFGRLIKFRLQSTQVLL